VTYENQEFKWYVLWWIWYLLTTGMGEALGLCLLIVVIDDLHFHVIGALGDFRNAPKDLDHDLFLGHMIRRGGLKPHPLPGLSLSPIPACRELTSLPLR
jgi:hypothetical protein